MKATPHSRQPVYVLLCRLQMSLQVHSECFNQINLLMLVFIFRDCLCYRCTGSTLHDITKLRKLFFIYKLLANISFIIGWYIYTLLLYKIIKLCIFILFLVSSLFISSSLSTYLPCISSRMSGFTVSSNSLRAPCFSFSVFSMLSWRSLILWSKLSRPYIASLSSFFIEWRIFLMIFCCSLFCT